jgi:predicted  nucleic acid-binding Zn-ribbon protein
VTELQDKVKDLEVRLQASDGQKKELQDKVKDLEAKMAKDREKANKKHDALQTRLDGIRQTSGIAATKEEVSTLRDQVQGLLRRR